MRLAASSAVMPLGPAVAGSDALTGAPPRRRGWRKFVRHLADDARSRGLSQPVHCIGDDCLLSVSRVVGRGLAKLKAGRNGLREKDFGHAQERQAQPASISRPGARTWIYPRRDARGDYDHCPHYVTRRTSGAQLSQRIESQGGKNSDRKSVSRTRSLFSRRRTLSDELGRADRARPASW